MLSLFLKKISPEPLFFERNSTCTFSFTDVDFMDNRIDIMVDGSGDGHSIALFPGEEVYVAYERGASNNEAEFNAVILALENLPARARARIRTDSQVVVWHLTRKDKQNPPTFFKKSQAIQNLIMEKDLSVEIRWIPRSENGADRHLRHYIQSLCGAAGNEPLHRRVRRLEAENLRLKAKLRKAMKMLENRPVIIREAVQPSWEMMES
jgi:ribonuclease HI